ncbi:ornithine cyclodeaminase family protein [Sphingopyxis panaciterrae]
MTELRGGDLGAIADQGRDIAQPPGAIALIDPGALADLVTMAEAIELIESAMVQLSAGEIEAPQRWQMPVSQNGSLALMPGVAPVWGHYGVKLLSLYENAAQNGLPGHQGVMLLFDRDTGRIASIVEANALTRLRTAAASAVATRALARDDATTLALIGCGEQARWHARAIPLVRPIEEVRIWGRSTQKVRQFARDHLAHIAHVVIAGDAEEAVRGADIVCTMTHASEPILDADWFEPGQHLNLVGASTKDEREIGGAIVARSRFFVDSRAHALAQAGELREAIANEWAGPEAICGEIGEVLGGGVHGRRAQSDITVYKSLGHVAQDLAVASFLQDRLGQSELVKKFPF